jgi:hypothetical protein
MRTTRVVVFEYRKAAIDAGHQPCKYCLPPWWLKVEAKILSRTSSQEAKEQPKGRKQPIDQPQVQSVEDQISTSGNLGFQNEQAKDEASKR